MRVPRASEAAAVVSGLWRGCGMEGGRREIVYGESTILERDCDLHVPRRHRPPAPTYRRPAGAMSEEIFVSIPPPDGTQNIPTANPPSATTRSASWREPMHHPSYGELYGCVPLLLRTLKLYGRVLLSAVCARDAATLCRVLTHPIKVFRMRDGSME